MKSFVKGLLVAILVVGLSAGAALAGSGVCVNNSSDAVKSVGLITLTDTGWTGSTSTYDCLTGWSDDWWSLTLTQGADVTIAVDDCCCPGDLLEVLVDDCIIGQTPQPVPYVWGCDQSGPLASGKFTVSLRPGTYTIKVRDFAFDTHQPPGSMCPAAYDVAISLDAYTGIPWPCDPLAGILNQLHTISQAIALLEAKDDKMEVKLDRLGRLDEAIFVIEAKNDKIEVKLDHLGRAVSVIEAKNDKMEAKLDNLGRLEGRIDSLIGLLKKLQYSVDLLESKMDRPTVR